MYPVTRLVVEDPLVGWANNIEKGDEGFLKGRNKRLKSLDYAERDMWIKSMDRVPIHGTCPPIHVRGENSTSSVVNSPSGPIWAHLTDWLPNMTFWTDGLAVMTWLLVGRLRGLAKSSRHGIRQKYLQDAIKPLYFFIIPTAKDCWLYSQLSLIFLFFKLTKTVTLSRQKCTWEIKNEKEKSNWNQGVISGLRCWPRQNTRKHQKSVFKG